MYKIETYIHPEDFESQSPVDISMQDSDTMEIEAYTPMPRQKRKYVMRFESEEENSQIESEEDDFETPKALRKEVSTIRRPDDTSASDSDFLENAVVDQASNTRGAYAHGQNNESDDESGFYMPQAQSKNRLDDKNKASKKDHDVQGLKTIDLTKIQKRATGTKEKRAFRTEVEGRRALIEKEDGKNQKVR